MVNPNKRVKRPNGLGNVYNYKTDEEGNVFTLPIKTIIKENYIVRFSETQTGVWLYDIDDVKTDFTTTYLAIYVDDVYSNYTIDGIKIKDGLVVSLRETKLWEKN